LIIFLIRNRRLLLTRVSLILDDFLEEKSDFLSKEDKREIEKIRNNYSSLFSSYLFKKIEPFVLPFYSRE